MRVEDPVQDLPLEDAVLQGEVLQLLMYLDSVAN